MTTDTMVNTSLKIAIAGASGFVGRALRRSLADQHEIIALTRSLSGVGDQQSSHGIEWRKCDEIKGMATILKGQAVVPNFQTNL